MSNFIYGKVFCSEEKDIFSSKIDFKMAELCVKNDFAICFLENKAANSLNKNICFRLSDNFMVQYCESFLEPVLYTENGEPILNNLSRDIEKLYELIKVIFSFDFVQKVELTLSYIELYGSEFEVCDAKIENFQEKLLNAFLENIDFPDIKFVIHR